MCAVGYDGALKMWDHQLQLVSAVKAAHDTHEGSARRIHCITVGSDGHIYTGGDDKVCPVYQLCDTTLVSASQAHFHPLLAVAFEVSHRHVADASSCFVGMGLSQVYYG